MYCTKTRSSINTSAVILPPCGRENTAWRKEIHQWKILLCENNSVFRFLVVYMTRHSSDSKVLRFYNTDEWQETHKRIFRRSVGQVGTSRVNRVELPEQISKGTLERKQRSASLIMEKDGYWKQGHTKRKRTLQENPNHRPLKQLFFSSKDPITLRVVKDSIQLVWKVTQQLTTWWRTVISGQPHVNHSGVSWNGSLVAPSDFPDEQQPNRLTAE